MLTGQKMNLCLLNLTYSLVEVSLLLPFCKAHFEYVCYSYIFRPTDPVEIFIASPSPVLFTAYEVGKVYEV